jgi:hypothetical protein
MGRVFIKLWNQGAKDFVGGVIEEDGKVYPTYPKTIYGTWQELKRPDGTVMGRYLTEVLRGPGLPNDIINPDVLLRNGSRLPPGVRFIERKNAGINPYEFLFNEH